jgi:hypothetical protein
MFKYTKSAFKKREFSLLNLIFISIFISYGFGNLGGKIPFYISQVLVYLLLFLSIIKILASRKSITIPIWYISYLFLLAMSVLLSIDLFDNVAKKQLINMIFYPLAFYFFVIISDFNKVIKTYLKFCLYASIIAILQEIGFLLGIKYLYDFTIYGVQMLYNTTGPFLRVTSIATEPSWFIYYILPGLYYSIANIFDKNTYSEFLSKWESSIILLASLITFSLNGYIAILVITLTFFFKSYTDKQSVNLLKKIIIVLGLIVFFRIVLNVPSIEERIDALLNLKEGYTSTNLSVFAIVSNFLVTKEGLIDNPLLGIGFFGHRFNYQDHINQYYSVNEIYMYLNNVDAANMFFRLLSEFGLLGLSLFLFFLYNYKIKDTGESLKYINSMALVALFIYSIRNGQYNTPFFWLYTIIYYYSYTLYKSKFRLK